MSYKTTAITITLKVEGIHCWPNCDIDEVLYLRHPHRHTFGIKCTFPVSHGDRQIEFIKTKHEIEKYIKYRWLDPVLKLCDFGSYSCEQIASILMTFFDDMIKCEVDEDGEFIATVAWER